jgi:hypothetical protein
MVSLLAGSVAEAVRLYVPAAVPLSWTAYAPVPAASAELVVSTEFPKPPSSSVFPWNLVVETVRPISPISALNSASIR